MLTRLTLAKNALHKSATARGWPGGDKTQGRKLDGFNGKAYKKM